MFIIIAMMFIFVGCGAETTTASRGSYEDVQNTKEAANELPIIK